MEEHGGGRLLSISEMAHIHNLTRTTLIYYDKIGLFQPDRVDDKGYRYYSPLQIPMLREICFLRNIGINLDDIKLHNKHLSSSYTMNILYQQLDTINEEMAELNRRKILIEQRVGIYQEATEYATDEYKPTIEYIPERYGVYWPWDENDLTIHGLNRSLMRTWNIMEKRDILPGQQWGSLIFKKYLGTENPLQSAVVYTLLPADVAKQHDAFSTIENFLTIPAGYYACICKYAMPFNVEHNAKLIHWIQNHGYEITGDLVDVCLLDTLFYEKDEEVDFCQIQIPINYHPKEGETAPLSST